MYRALILFVLLNCGTSQASTLFDDHSVIDITLQGPLSSVIEDFVERRERNFSLRIDDASLAVQVRLRGNSRLVHCRFPPLRLELSSAEPVPGVFAGQDKLKLVTHCRASEHFEQNVLDEYAAYRILNLLTTRSFRVRLLRVRYVDTDRPAEKPAMHYAFLIESDEALADRLGGEIIDVPHVTREMLDAGHSALVYVFQFLIGNTDWSHVRFLGDQSCCHNGRLIAAGEHKYYVPYDFDMSGLVNARYAKPQPELRLRSVRVRRYRGYCTEPEHLSEALRTVVARREEIVEAFEGLPHLSEKSRNSGAEYLRRFFELAANEDMLVREFARRCL